MLHTFFFFVFGLLLFSFFRSGGEIGKTHTERRDNISVIPFSFFEVVCIPFFFFCLAVRGGITTKLFWNWD
jgi:hypothetical protein